LKFWQITEENFVNKCLLMFSFAIFAKKTLKCSQLQTCCIPLKPKSRMGRTKNSVTASLSLSAKLYISSISVLQISSTNHRLHWLIISFYRVGYVGLSWPGTTCYVFTIGFKSAISRPLLNIIPIQGLSCTTFKEILQF